MISALNYSDKIFFNKTCGSNLDDTEDNWYVKVFNALDLEDSFRAGQDNPSFATIDKIFKLNKQYLVSCKEKQTVPTAYGRRCFIEKFWNDSESI